ncbi:MAG TPA: porin family protein [Bacteroidales bacterium]|nr:porin family protein [Bacteroidales bacterium]
MKKVITLLVMLFVVSLATEVVAQTIRARAGFNLSKMLMKDDDKTLSSEDEYKMLPGFHLGATAEIPFSDMFSFETGLLLSTKGYKYKDEGSLYETEGKVTLYYLEIPITGKATFDVGGVKVYGVFGPYLGFGLTGKYKNEFTIAGITEKSDGDIEWGTDAEKDDYKRLDFGLTVGAGVEIDAFQIGINYGLGLANLSPNSDNGYRQKNRVLGITIGYKIFAL